MFLLQDISNVGLRNMATDEALLDFVRLHNVPVLRFYTWSEPTLSLGYFQRYDDRQSHAASRDINVVRRLSGGGAIIHDRELTYSLAIPPGHRFAERQRLELYDVVHRRAIDILRDWGFTARLASEIPGLADKETRKDVFLCFQRFAPGDLIVQTTDGSWVKILGSAQYRDRHGAVLQHGSLIWNRSDAAPELPGLNDLGSPHKAPTDSLRHERFQNAFIPKILVDFDEPGEAFPEEKRKEMFGDIEIIEKKRYAGAWVGKK